MWSIAKKDLKLFWADKRAVLLSFLLPIGLISVFALIFGGASDDPPRPIVSVLVDDQDQSEISKKILVSLDSIQGLVMEAAPQEEALERIRKGNRLGVIVFYQGFGDSVTAGGSIPLEFFFDRARIMELGIIQQLLMGAIMENIGQELSRTNLRKMLEQQFSNLPDYMRDSIQLQVDRSFIQEQKEEDEKPFLKYTAVVGDEKGNLGLIQAVAGTAVMMLLFSVAGSGSTLLQEKEEGTLKRLLYSPLNPNDILYGKMLSTIIMAITQLVVMFLFAAIVFKLDLSTNLPALIIMILVTAWVCSSFGIFLASISKSRKQVEAMSTIVILVMSAIGGSMMPTIFMPKFMQEMAVFSVNYWSIQGFYDIFWRQLPFLSIWDNAAVMSGIAIVLSFVAIKLFKRNILSLV